MNISPLEALLCDDGSALPTSEFMLCGQKSPSQPMQTLGWIRLYASYLIVMAKLYLSLLSSHEGY